MFFSRSISKQTRPTPESLCEALSLPRIVYGQALLEWYEEISKLSPYSQEQSPILNRQRSSGGDYPLVMKTGFYLHSSESGPQLVLPTYEEGNGDSRHKITDQKILNSLRDGPLDTLTIAKKILGRTTWRRPINGTLYRMASEGKIIHHQEEDLHVWELTSSEPVFPIVVPPVPSAAMA